MLNFTQWFQDTCRKWTNVWKIKIYLDFIKYMHMDVYIDHSDNKGANLWFSFKTTIDSSQFFYGSTIIIIIFFISTLYFWPWLQTPNEKPQKKFPSPKKLLPNEVLLGIIWLLLHKVQGFFKLISQRIKMKFPDTGNKTSWPCVWALTNTCLHAVQPTQLPANKLNNFAQMLK